jgi:hypothetical protein
MVQIKRNKVITKKKHETKIPPMGRKEIEASKKVLRLLRTMSK